MRAYRALGEPQFTHEELGEALLKDEYMHGRLTIEEFEERIGRLLSGDMSVIPMGGLPPPETGRPEVR